MHCEVKTNLSIAHFVISVSQEWQSSNLQVVADKSCLTFIVDEPPKSDIALPYSREIQLYFEGLHMLPASCTGLRWEADNELHLRLQLKDPGMVPLNGKEKAAHHEEKLLAPFKATNFSAMCSMCGEVLITKKKFQRVLPLPSDNWFDMPDSLFCHSTPTDAKFETNREKLLPNALDCFVGAAFFLVAMETIREGSVYYLKSVVRCCRCNHQLGNLFSDSSCNEQTRQAVQLSTFQVSLNNSKPQCVLSSTVDTLLSYRRLFNCFRFVIDSSQGSSTKAFLLIWLLEMDTHIYRMDISKLISLNYHHLNPSRCIKVLYQDCLRSDPDKKSITEAWERDLTIHSLALPHAICLKLLNVLIESTASLPASMRSVNGFYVGLLPLPQAL